MPYHTVLLARAYDIAERIEEALAALDESLQIVEKTGERWLEVEIHRHKGQLLLRQGHVDAAEKHYLTALSSARKQGAKLWELRAATSLARLRREHRDSTARSRTAEQRQVLRNRQGGPERLRPSHEP